MPPAKPYVDIAQQLRAAYDGSAAARNEFVRPPWQVAEREAFLQRLLAEKRQSVLEVGAGAGHDSQHFLEHGMRVVATDLSNGMVQMCRARGLEAYAMDVLGLDFPNASFDAAYAMNSLLHVPASHFIESLQAIRRLLRPGALFYLGQYGGKSFEGVPPDDLHTPPRFFSFRDDVGMRSSFVGLFEEVDFHVLTDGLYFQSATLRVPAC